MNHVNHQEHVSGNVLVVEIVYQAMLGSQLPGASVETTFLQKFRCIVQMEARKQRQRYAMNCSCTTLTMLERSLETREMGSYDTGVSTTTAAAAEFMFIKTRSLSR